MQSASSRDTSERRTRIACKFCGEAIELTRMRDHLRSAHQVDSAQLETLYLDARVEARRSRRSQRL